MVLRFLPPHECGRVPRISARRRHTGRLPSLSRRCLRSFPAIADRTRVRWAVPFLMLFAAALLGTGCTQSTEPPASLFLTITPKLGGIMVGTTFQLTAELRDASGRILAPDSVRWTSSDASILTVSAEGQLRALRGAAPSAKIVATAYRGASSASAELVIFVGIVLPSRTDREQSAGGQR